MISFGRSICTDLTAAERREWLVTNGLGGFASGTVAGTLTRRYHGLLVAATHPPVGRRLLVAKIDERATYRGVAYDLGANRWKDGSVSPQGFALIERFELDGTLPVWQFALGDALLEKRVWMEHGRNATYVRYRVLRSAAPVELALRVFVDDRDFHGNTHAGDRRVEIAAIDGGLRADAHLEGGVPYAVRADRGACAIENVWYRDFVLAQETLRGLDDRDDHLAAGSFTATLGAGESIALFCSDAVPPAGGDAAASLARERERQAALIATWRATPRAADAPDWMVQCVLAADQFVVRRPIGGDDDGRSLIAGYHWFGDWGRDTAIALPGIALSTGRPAIAARILRAFARYVDGGMLPNDFPDDGRAPEYNTADAALWYVEAVARYVEASGDAAALHDLLPVVLQIVRAYRDGTRYGIHVDPADGLVVAAAPGVQLTWMDAKIGDWVVTPRMGKPIEISALWYNALHRTIGFAKAAGIDAGEFERLASAIRFDRYWNANAGYCYDVLDGPDGDDATLRPNQLFAAALPHAPLGGDRLRAVVDVCAARLFTPGGMRSLDPADPAFSPRYAGSPRERDAAYHRGTAWAWLLGPFAVAHARAYGDAGAARAFLEPLAGQLDDYGLGSIAELADATAPFAPQGAIAQAWSVGELLRAWNDVAAAAAAGSASSGRQ